MRQLEVLFTPADFTALSKRDLSRATCIVFDVLRATTTMLTALNNGAEAIVPVAEIAEAIAWLQRKPDVLLAGERNGVRITAAQSGGVDFDLGNSPREMTAERVRGRTLVMTTTNGTRALQACRGAQHTVIASFANLGPVMRWIDGTQPQELLLVCSGTGEQAAYEDVLAAGALCGLLAKKISSELLSDSALMARELTRAAQPDLFMAVKNARNARRLLAIPELANDVAFCLRRDTVGLVATMDAEGFVRRTA